MSDEQALRLEHVALNVSDPVGMARWYGEHLGLRAVVEGAAPAYGRFLAAGGDHVLLEIYANGEAPRPDYWAWDARQFHLAFVVEDVQAVRRRLLAAGAKAEGEATVTAGGDEVLVLRDPWGVPLQFVRRARPLLK